MHNAYKDIGLYTNAEALLKEADGWWVGIDDNDPSLYRWFMAFRTTPFGRKIIYSGTDGSRIAITEFKHVRIWLFNDVEKHYYSEASGAMERLLERGNIPKVPVEKVQEILGKTIVPVDEYSYERTIGDGAKRKVMFGHPKISRFVSSLLHLNAKL